MCFQQDRMLNQPKKSIPDVGPDLDTCWLHTNSAGIILSASPKMLALVGRNKSQLSGSPLEKIVEAEDVQSLRTLLERAESHETAAIPLTLKGKAGRRKMYFTVEQVHDEIHASPVFVWMAQDHNTTATPHALATGVDWFQQLFDTSNELMAIADARGRLQRVNNAFADALGYIPSELLSQPLILYIHPGDRTAVSAMLEQAFIYNQHQLEFRVLCNHDLEKWFSWSTTLLDTDNILLIARDISEHKETSDALIKSRTELYRLENVHRQLNEIVEKQQAAEEKIRFQAQVTENVSDGLIATDPNFIVISFNKAAESIYGYSASEIIGKPIRELIHHHYIGRTREEVLQLLYRYERWEGEAYYDRRDGKRIYMLCSYAVIRNQQGEHIGFAGIHRDITERRQSEEALRISEERYRSVVHALGEGIIMLDQNKKIIACNRSAEEILGITAKQMEEQVHSPECIHEDGTPFPLHEHPSLVTLETGKSLKNVIMGIRRPDGALVWISVNTEPIYYSESSAAPDAVVASFVDITEKKAAEAELQYSQQQLREYSERITNILDSITDGFIAVDKQFNILLWNHAVENITGIKAVNAIGANIEKVFPEFISPVEYPQYVKALESNASVSFEHFIDGFKRWFETSVYPFEQGIFIYFRDITERKKQEELLKLEKEVLKINAQSAVSLKTTIDYLLEGLEKTFPGMLCSVLVLDEDQETARHLSAPSLPAEFTSVIDGFHIGPAVGSCGTAMHRKEKVITRDILTDPLWENYRYLAEQFRLRACWSFPILNVRNEVLATIAAYFREPRTPSKDEMNILERVSNLLRIIIENKNAEAKIRVSNERYLLVTKATNDAIWDWDIATKTLYWGEGFFTLFGYKPGYVDSSLGFWERLIHEDDRERVMTGLRKFINDNNAQIWEDEYRFRKANGQYALVYDRGFLIFDHSGKINRMVGSLQDITEKKEMQQKLLKQELDRQKLIAQAVVNAQEKERADIGKELHDNVNQILSTAKLYLELAKTEEDERLDLINRSTDNISHAINEIRSISRSLVPPSVGDLGLIESIQDLVENIRATRKLQVEFYHQGNIDNVLDEKRKLMLFRIVQEQVNNILRHSQATIMTIELYEEGRMIELTIHDNGVGFDMEKVKQKKGVGLSNIISRAELFNGKVIIKTSPGNGCRLNINVPISNF